MIMAPFFSVIVPVKDGSAVLPRCLGAIRASDLTRDRYELIVVDDGSTDDTDAIARRTADRIIRVDEGPKGPGWARNRGAEAARGEWLVFIDADVVVTPRTLSLLTDVVSRHPEISAVFGAYDEHPADPGFLSQYRNLMHRFVHLTGAGEASTFWAGLGAVRRDAFLAVDGFDPERFPRPQIEDIDLGYRLGDAGYRILLCPELEGRHLKRWTFIDMVRTDLFSRAVPWMRLILSRRSSRREEAALNLRRGEKVKTALVGGGLAAVAAGAVTGRGLWMLVGVAALLAVVGWNAPMFVWYARLRGLWFAARVVPMNLLYYLINGAGAVIAIAQHRFSPADDPAKIQGGRPDPIEAGS